MRIAWILYGSLSQRTGGTIYDAQIVAALRHRGLDVEVLSLERGGSSAALLRALARLRPDAVVGDELCFRELAFVFPRALFTRRVLLVHHLTCWETELPPSARARARLAERTALRHADAVVVTSRATHRRLVAEACRRPIEIVTCGADRLASAEARRSAEVVRFLFVGAVIRRKRVRELVEAFASVSGPTELRIAGRTDADPAYARVVGLEAATTGGRVALLGEIDDDTLAEELASAHALVLPSSLEGYGIAATEAVRAGTPVLAAACEGLVDALSSCSAAVRFVSPASLVPSLRAAMQELATDDSVRRSMQRAAAAAAATLPTWAEAGDAFAGVLSRS